MKKSQNTYAALWPWSRAQFFKVGGISLAVLFLLCAVSQKDFFSFKYYALAASSTASATSSTGNTALGDSDNPGSLGNLVDSLVVSPLNKTLYDQKLMQLANYPVYPVVKVVPKPGFATSSVAASSTPVVHRWPVKTVYPNAGALLPFNRIVAYYGNFYSANMGVLGEYPTQTMLHMLQGVVAQWTLADPTTPVIPAIDYIAVTAQGTPGDDGKYRLRMPDDQIQKAIDLANEVHGIVFLDIQVGQSNVQTEVPLLLKYLKMPNVHLALDPEFSMKNGKKPGSVIGTMDASDINFAANYLANVVRENNLTPKILVVHRFTQGMITNANEITPLPEVQVVIDMDGWGDPAHKKKAYLDVVTDEPVQFTGMKLFYKNDVRGTSTGMMSPSDVLKLQPQPSYIQYQ